MMLTDIAPLRAQCPEVSLCMDAYLYTEVAVPKSLGDRL